MIQAPERECPAGCGQSQPDTYSGGSTKPPGEKDLGNGVLAEGAVFIRMDIVNDNGAMHILKAQEFLVFF